MLVALLTLLLGLTCYCYGSSTEPSNYGFWVENKEIWAFDYCNILRSSPTDIGESSRFECRNGNWVTKIWKYNTECDGEPDVVDTASCIKPHCTCKENANKNNKLVEFKMYDDPSCSGDYYSTAAAVIEQCFEYNNKGYILKCTDNMITRTEYDKVDCSSQAKYIISDITPKNTEYYCYSFKCGTNSHRFDDNKGHRKSGLHLLLFVFMVSIFVLLGN